MLNVTILAQAIAAVRRQVHYNNGGASPLTPQQENAIVYGANQEAQAIYDWILTAQVNVNVTVGGVTPGTGTSAITPNIGTIS
jgi:hypothetical protein